LKESESTNFNFIDAINRPDTYELLYPSKIEGTVIIALYERLNKGKYTNGFFSEDEIHSLFSTFQSSDRTTDKYYPKERNKQRIRKLLKYFLNYDEEQRLYSFQEYGRSFCEIARKTLKGSFDPTQIELICSNLKRDLDQAFGSDEALVNWFEINLDVYKTKLAQQTDFLHQQIDVAVNKLRKDVLSQNDDPIDLLKRVNDDLTDIQNKNRELRIAFEDTDRINSALIKIETENESVIDFIEDTAVFFKRIQTKLRTTDRRLDRIQPKIKQLFATLSRPELSAKTELFIHFLLKHSKLAAGYNDKEILLPIEVKPLLVNEKRPKLLTFKRNSSLFPTPSKPRKRYILDSGFQKKNKKEIQKKINGFKRVDGWVNQLLAQLKKDDFLDVSSSFFEVLKIDKDFEIATKVAFTVVEKAHLIKQYEVLVNETDLVTSNDSKTSLWRVVIQKI
jgi:hypothetical protein